MKKPKYKKGFESVHKEEKKKRVKKEFVWTLLIAVIMVTSIIGFMWVGEEESAYTYKEKYEFTRKNNEFVYKQDGGEFVFRYLPYEAEEIVGPLRASRIKRPMIYLTFDPDSELIGSIDLLRFELENELPRFNIYLSQGIISNKSGIYTLPIIDCEDASLNTPVIKFAKANETVITEQDNCFLFKAKNDNDLEKLKDAMIYSLLGII